MDLYHYSNEKHDFSKNVHEIKEIFAYADDK